MSNKPNGETPGGDLPESDASIEGGTNGAVDGVSVAALKRGYSKQGAMPVEDSLYLFPFYPGPATSGWVE